MRFAGSAVEDFMGSGPRMGEIAASAAVGDAKENLAGMDAMRETLGMGIKTYGDVYGADMVMDAKAKYNAASQQAQNMSKAGGLLGQGLGGLGSLGGNSGSGNWTPSGGWGNFGSNWGG